MSIPPIMTRHSNPSNLEVDNNKDQPELYKNIFQNLSVEDIHSLSLSTNTVTTDPNELNETLVTNEVICKQLSSEIIDYCKNDNPIALKMLIEKLVADDKPFKVKVKELEIARSYCCTHNHIDLFSLLLEYAAKTDHIEIVEACINCNQFQEIRVESLGTAMRNAAGFGCINVVKALIHCTRCKEISVESLGSALRMAARNATSVAHSEVVKAIIDCDQFNKITTKNLGKAFEHAAATHRPDIIQIFINCDRFKEFRAENLGKAFRIAVGFGHIDTVQAMIASSQFKNLPLAELQRGFRTAAKYGHIEVIQALINCNRFKEISSDSCLNDALKIATNFGHTNIVQAIKASF